LILIEATKEGVEFGLLKQQLRFEMPRQASGKTGLADADWAFDNNVTGRGERVFLH
jgi:hypothetical protein